MKSFGTTMSELGTGAFFESLGQYVYGYRKEDSFTWDYIGKGNGNRAVQHIKTKGYNAKNLYIIAKNLERFADKSDAESFLLESFLITTTKPTDNRVAGHYEECFTMAKWSELFNEFQASMYDNFEALPTWYVENYEKIKGKVGVVTIKSDVFYLESKTLNKVQFSWYTNTDGSTKSVKFQVWNTDENESEVKRQQIYSFCESMGIDHDEVELTGTRQSYEIKKELDVDQVMEIFINFVS
jgi:hypothetical protein